MADAKTELNPGSGGSYIDETGVDYAGETRRRARIQLGGSAQGDLIEPKNAAPGSSDYALPVRQVGGVATQADVQAVRDRLPVPSLTSRMLARQPADGYTLWFDTANASHIYTLEAPAGTAASATGFRGIRVTVDADGNPVGAVETNTSATLTFDNRTSDAGWSS